MQVLASYNIKGGVGKTAAAVNLAHLAAAEGARVLLWDLDPQGAATYYFRAEPGLPVRPKKLFRAKHALAAAVRETDEPNLDLVPADFDLRNLDLTLEASGKPRRRLRRALKPMRGIYDYVFLDCAPSISLVSESIFEASDALLIPTIPTPLSLRTYEQLTEFLRNHHMTRPQLLPFFSMVDRRKKLQRDIVDARPPLVAGVLNTVIPYASDIERMGSERAAVAGFSPSSIAGMAFSSLWGEICNRLR